ncbi:hypothetical protein SBOR_0151 [Sclerotinia borealis F-4128]|uniref:F-box domain-containing protein n=1 Tax=Sclerotinia borealis (strain F-4128) TaxID=1432307 RepID=W9CTM2_SCLBF|nr:hypothetical protein SBOR_0151 [Sclerotinia borealis F-4128]
MANKNQPPKVSDISTGQKAYAKAMENAGTCQSAALVSKNVIQRQILLQGPTKTQREVHLPQETLRRICSYIEPNELPKVRLVSRGYSHAAAVPMFKTMRLTFLPTSFKRLLNVAESTTLQHHVLELIYDSEWNIDEQGNSTLDSVIHHYSYRSEFDEALAKLTNLNAVQFHPSCKVSGEPGYRTTKNGQLLEKDILFINRRGFDSFWSFLKSSLRNAPRLRSIIASQRIQFTLGGFTKLSNEETEALGRLYNLSLEVDGAFEDQLVAILSCTPNLRSLQLVHNSGQCDFSEVVNPSTRFHSLVSLKLVGFNLNERYFKQFLLANAHSLRSLSLRDLKLEITEEEYTSKKYRRSNQWIRMFHFFGQSMHLEEIELSGNLYTSLSGTWSAQIFLEGDDLYEPSSLMLRLKQYITHAEGGSFPLPHPDEDLTNVNLKKYGNNAGLFWYKILKKHGEIRLLKKEPSKPSAFKGILEWGDSDSDSDLDSVSEIDDYDASSDLLSELDNYDASDSPSPSSELESMAALDDFQSDTDDEYLSELEDPQAEIEEMTPESAFEQVKSLLLANQDSWTDGERETLIAMMGEFMTSGEEKGFDLNALEEEKPLSNGSAP